MTQVIFFPLIEYYKMSDGPKPCVPGTDKGCVNSCGAGPLNVQQLLGGSAALILAFGYKAYTKAAQKHKKETGEELTVRAWFNGQKVTKKGIMVGMASGVVFGMIDNLGLFLGMSALDEKFKQLPGGRYENVTAGLGNTFSDAIGAFLGTFVGNLIADTYEVYDYPIWAEAAGIIIGCLIGVYLPYFYLKANGSRDKNGNICGLGKYSA